MRTPGLHAAIALVVTALHAAATARCDDVAVGTQGGRVLTGVVDSRTDDRYLWLRQDTQGISLAIMTPWHSIETVAINGRMVDVLDLRRRSSAMATEHRATAATLSRGTAAQKSPPVQRLQAIALRDACLVNLDRDVEPDGVQVRLGPIDDSGRLVAVDGTITATLVTERRPALQPRVEFAAAERWAQPVVAEAFSNGPATLTLPFRNLQPERELGLLPDASLSIVLSARGHGNFAASAPVLIRQFDPLRDNHQLQEGSRFLPGELSGRNSRQRLGPVQGLWLHWSR